MVMWMVLDEEMMQVLGSCEWGVGMYDMTYLLRSFV